MLKSGKNCCTKEFPGRVMQQFRGRHYHCFQKLRNGNQENGATLYCCSIVKSHAFKPLSFSGIQSCFNDLTQKNVATVIALVDISYFKSHLRLSSYSDHLALFQRHALCEICFHLWPLFKSNFMAKLNLDFAGFAHFKCV